MDTVQSHATPQSTHTCCFCISHYTEVLLLVKPHSAVPAKSNGKEPIGLGDEAVPRQKRLNQRMKNLHPLKVVEKSVFMVHTPQEHKAPQGHLSTAMQWEDQREQVRKKLIQGFLHIFWDPLPQSPRCFFKEILEGTVGPWGAMMWSMNYSVVPMLPPLFTWDTQDTSV